MLDEWVRSLTGDNEEGASFFKSKKGRYLIIIAISLGLLALVWKPAPNVDNQSPKEILQQLPANSSVKAQLTQELKVILSQIEGAGEVEVSITLASDGEKSYASNSVDEKREIEESNPQGTVQETVETKRSRDLAVTSGDALLIENKFPQVIGVLVVAEGAKYPVVKERLTAATATLLDIPSHKVSVMPGQGGGI